MKNAPQHKTSMFGSLQSSDFGGLRMPSPKVNTITEIEGENKSVSDSSVHKSNKRQDEYATQYYSPMGIKIDMGKNMTDSALKAKTPAESLVLDKVSDVNRWGKDSSRMQLMSCEDNEAMEFNRPRLSNHRADSNRSPDPDVLRRHGSQFKMSPGSKDKSFNFRNAGMAAIVNTPSTQHLHGPAEKPKAHESLNTDGPFNIGLDRDENGSSNNLRPGSGTRSNRALGLA